MPDTGSPRNKALDLLAHREHAVGELRAKLIARGFEAAEVDAAIERLEREGLVSDERFVGAFVASSVRKGRGPVRIRADLMKRGVDEALIGRYVERADVDWTELARRVRVRKYGPEGCADLREKARQGRFLRQRGFTGEQARAALDGGEAEPADFDFDDLQ